MDLDGKLPDDVQLVLDVAARLDLSEYDVFRLAFLRWSGDEQAELDRLEPIFVRYMFEQRVPPWVCSFGHDVLDDDAASSAATRRILAEAQRMQHPPQISRGLRFAVGALLVTFVVIVMAEFSARLLGVGERCVFPPCY